MAKLKQREETQLDIFSAKCGDLRYTRFRKGNVYSAGILCSTRLPRPRWDTYGCSRVL